MKCEICGRFCRRWVDAFDEETWRCVKAYYDIYAMQWEHE